MEGDESAVDHLYSTPYFKHLNVKTEIISKAFIGHFIVPKNPLTVLQAFNVSAILWALTRTHTGRFCWLLIFLVSFIMDHINQIWHQWQVPNSSQHLFDAVQLLWRLTASFTSKMLNASVTEDVRGNAVYLSTAVRCLWGSLALKDSGTSLHGSKSDWN